jgi:hypothetical protein
VAFQANGQAPLASVSVCAIQRAVGIAAKY